ncbi:hypothetical protein IC744_16195 [Microbacterium hominis]|uniref:hypothetical protein n=1 Tax=Microbacterium TaxID=33882 RepID=UPI00168A9F9A|nr:MULTISPECIES: hypothetical protein [Microbacterium]QOC24802.1 hypothetical protein IC745_10440 [Microbacterium hominis]QOC28856.1 hypothetical protein IC744_16195 [Microbacterium hominis]QYF98943.1 helix-turn-helix domain-containing protein [Microbacterium sp. PAMC21962]
MHTDKTARFTEALVSEIKAEMGRRDLSSRAIARAIGVNAQYVSSRLDGGNPRTGERVILNIRDLFAMAAAMDLDPAELVQRAEAIAEDYALAASDDDDWQSRQEAENE